MAETAQTLDRGLSVLSLLADSADGLTVTALARELSVSRAVVYRLTATLVERGFVARSADGRYNLGPQVARLSGHFDATLREIARPHLRMLADSLASSAWLATISDDGDHGVAIVIAVAEPTHAPVAVRIRQGTRLPVAESVVGEAIRAKRTADTAVSARREQPASGPLEPRGCLNAQALAFRAGSSVQAVLGIVPVRRLTDAAATEPLLAAASSIRLALY